MVSAIFISPLKPKKSAIGEQWSSHYSIHKDIKTHIQVHSTNPNQPLVIFVHGWRSTSASVADRAMWFVEKNWNALLLELPGHGQSSPIHRWNAITSAEHVEYHLRNLSEYISVSKDAPIFLYGHSMGGYLCSRVSSQQSKVTRVQHHRCCLRIPPDAVLVHLRRDMPPTPHSTIFAPYAPQTVV
jgi:alpha-beta hydrolase superfamily lysophospholipase